MASKSNVLQVENDRLRSTINALSTRLEDVADSLIKMGLLNNTPHDRYKFVHGEATNNFPSVKVAEFEDVDGWVSQ
jgi:hypothetical protein